MSARSFTLDKKRQGNITVYRDGLSFYQIVLHDTAIVTRYSDGTIVIKTGGWLTNTTKTAINRALDLFNIDAAIWQQKFKWKLRVGDSIIDFYDGVRINDPISQMLKRLSIE